MRIFLALLLILPPIQDRKADAPRLLPLFEPIQDKKQEAPRLLLRSKSSPGIPSLDEANAQFKAWASRADELKETAPGLALHGLLTGDESSAKKAAEELKKMSADEGYGLYQAGPVLYLPLTYDWLYAWKGFADRKAVEEKVVKTADACMTFLKGGSGDHVFHTSAPRAAMGVGLAGLALEGRHPKGAEFVKFAQEYLEKTYFPAMEYLDGTAVAGMSYGVTEGFAPLCYLLWAFKSAKGIDYFAKQKGWLEKRLHYMIASTLPDHTFVRWGDIVTGDRCSTRHEVRNVVDMLARGLDSREGRAFSTRIAKKWKNGEGYHSTVLWAGLLFAPKATEAEPALPLSQLYGQNSVGQAFFRSGWGEGDTVVFFKAGDYFDDHGHFDQGSFTIYRKGHLAVDAFAYGDFGADHRTKYGRHAVAHNLVLFARDEGQRAVKAMDSHDLEDYLKKKKSKGLETGDVIAWTAEKEWTYLSADLTAAYDSKVATLVTRELVWFKNRYLIVFDKVEATEPARWLLHTMTAPTVREPAFSVQEKDSKLVGVTLLPKKPKVALIEGWKADGKDYPPNDKGEFAAAGGHGLEISGGTMFLHVLSALDLTEELPAVKLVEGESVGVEIAGKRILFKKTGLSKACSVK